MISLHNVVLAIIYLLFFLSGAAALIYEVIWVRSLSLVFGGSHLAVTAVLSVFMAGLAIGGYLIGKLVDRSRDLLKIYGILELGVAGFSLFFVLLMKLYPYLYVPLARAAGDNLIFITIFRILFAVVAMIGPTTLMGGTLPVLARFISMRHGSFGERLSFLYGFNTLGAVAGTVTVGFILLRYFSVSTTLWITIATNTFIGLASIFLNKWARDLQGDELREMFPQADLRDESGTDTSTGEVFFSQKLVLWGIGISGFCALGYEVLWTRVLSMVVGASVYGFTIMLVAFLAGIALGSKAFGLILNRASGMFKVKSRSIVCFGVVQIVIGCSALAVTILLRDLPAYAIRIQNLLLGTGIGEFEVRQGANFIVAFSHMFLPAFFMGVAFPLAGKIYAGERTGIGGAVGEVLAYNTIGAILGASASGFALIYLFGIERSLQLLTLVNVGTGIVIASSVARNRFLSWAIAGSVAAVITILAAQPDIWRIWDRKYFAIFRNNQRDAFNTPFGIKDAMENTEVLYYAEGTEATVSSIRIKGGSQAFITNGRIEASDQKEDIQCQYVLGHLPMLLHRNPKKVFVLGTGSGMTLGATSVHPEVEEITLAEIEPKVFGVTRTFSRYNHNVLDNPKIKIVVNDGRNLLLTTKDRFDVITADPIHPWFSGAGYLYTDEYFRLASERLRPGGIICQWLPIYELTVKDLQSIVKSFTKNFRYTLMWLTHNDAELVGSNEPFEINESELEKRIVRSPEIAQDLANVFMGSSADLLSYFVMGTQGLKAFGNGGVLNTDDNLHLEFSAPMSVGIGRMETNSEALGMYRESLLPYLAPAMDGNTGTESTKKWIHHLDAARVYDRAHSLFLGGRFDTPEFRRHMANLEESYPWYAPGKFLKNEYRFEVERTPRLLASVRLPCEMGTGEKGFLEISAVTMRVGDERAAVVFVDNRDRMVYGQHYIDGIKESLDGMIALFSKEVLNEISVAYNSEVAVVTRGVSIPKESRVRWMVKETISRKIREITSLQGAGNQ